MSDINSKKNSLFNIRIVKNMMFSIFFASPVLYLSTCSYISHMSEQGFELIEVGDSEEIVVNKLGEPSLRENLGSQPFYRYASQGCLPPCIERWWYENRMSFDTEAWSVEYGSEKRIIKKK